MTKSGALAKRKRVQAAKAPLPAALRTAACIGACCPKCNAQPSASRLAPAHNSQPDFNIDNDQLDSGDGSVFDLCFALTNKGANKWELRMKADAVPLLAIFEKKMRLEIPLFQRQYVWSKEQQWEPLWEDIARKFTEYLEGRKDAPVHFLGAMVLDQKQTPTTHVERRQVIDGQQRLTTLQIFIASFRDFCRAQECEELAKECDAFILNKGMMADPAFDKFKVWPTQLDRGQFMDIISSGSRIDLEKKHPLIFKPRARKPEPRPRMVEAYLFFYEQIADFFNGSRSGGCPEFCVNGMGFNAEASCPRTGW